MHAKFHCGITPSLIASLWTFQPTIGAHVCFKSFYGPAPKGAGIIIFSDFSQNILKPQDSFQLVDLLKVFSNFRKWTIHVPSESTIKPTLLFWMTCCNVIIPNNKISLDTNGRVFGGTSHNLIFWLFLENFSISEQTIDRALTIHTEL